MCTLQLGLHFDVTLFSYTITMATQGATLLHYLLIVFNQESISYNHSTANAVVYMPLCYYYYSED